MTKFIIESDSLKGLQDALNELTSSTTKTVVPAKVEPATPAPKAPIAPAPPKAPIAPAPPKAPIAPAPPKAPAPAQAKAPAPAKAKTKTVDIEEVRTYQRGMIESGGADAKEFIKSILKDFGVTSLSELPEELRGEYLTALQANSQVEDENDLD